MVVDTDVIIRFLTADDSKKADRFEKFLKSGKKIILTDVTFAELYWTLRSFYKFPKDKILASLDTLLQSSSVTSNKDLLSNTILLLKKKNISFIDAYTASYAQFESDGIILSYDKGFDRTPNIKRIEP